MTECSWLARYESATFTYWTVSPNFFQPRHVARRSASSASVPPSRTVRLPTAPMQPLAADDVAAALADVVVGAPAIGIVELAGPETLPIAEFVGRFLAASGDTRTVVADPQARYFGAALDDRGLNPGDSPRIGPTRFEDWLAGRHR